MNLQLTYRAAADESELKQGVINIDEYVGHPGLEFDTLGKIVEEHTRRRLETYDRIVREQLIKLGWTPPPEPQDVSHGSRMTGDAAGAACLAKAERVADFDAHGAAQAMRNHLATHPFSSSELMTQAAKLKGFVPHDDRAFGPVISAMARRGEIRQVGECARVRGNGTSGGRIWELCRA